MSIATPETMSWQRPADIFEAVGHRVRLEVLLAVAEEDYRPQRDIAAEIGASIRGVSEGLARLRSLGLVAARREPDDGRVIHYRPTESGWRLIDLARDLRRGL